MLYAHFCPSQRAHPATPAPVQLAREAAAGELGLLPSSSSPVAPSSTPIHLQGSWAGRQQGGSGCHVGVAAPHPTLPRCAAPAAASQGQRQHPFGLTCRAPLGRGRGRCRSGGWTRRHRCGGISTGPGTKRVSQASEARRAGERAGVLHAERRMQRRARGAWEPRHCCIPS